MRLLFVWGPVVALMTLIYIASSSANLDPLPGRFLDKVLHVAVYAVLGALFARALAGGRLTATTWPHVIAAIVLSTLYGISDEWHQSFVPGRTPDPMDVVADALGATVGALGTLVLARMLAARAREGSRFEVQGSEPRRGYTAEIDHEPRE